MNELQRILQAFSHSQQKGQRTALATVVQTQGSVYRRPGARMLLTEAGETIAAISGGCLEADILARAQAGIKEDSPPFVVRYDAMNHEEDILLGFGLGCNGVVDVLVESLSAEAATRQLSFLEECLRSHQTGVIATVFAGEGVIGSRVMVKADGSMINQIADPNLAEIITTEAQKTLTKGKTHSQSYPSPAGEVSVLLEAISPPFPLLVFGAGYDAIPVVQFAKQLGWQVTVIDHRGEYLNRDRFPQADQLLACKPDPPDSYQHLLTPETVAVVMTHRYVSDRAFLKNLIPSPVRYLGVLGPKHRMAKLWEDLAEDGVMGTVEQQQRVYNPIGLDIGTETPEEIALSIVAEIQTVISKRSGGCLRDRARSIHTPDHSWTKSASSS